MWLSIHAVIATAQSASRPLASLAARSVESAARPSHVVFTLPKHWLHSLETSVLSTPAVSCCLPDLMEIAADRHRLGARTGILAVLHTWNRDWNIIPPALPGSCRRPGT
jgi:hypothetical protein